MQALLRAVEVRHDFEASEWIDGLCGKWGGWRNSDGDDRCYWDGFGGGSSSGTLTEIVLLCHTYFLQEMLTLVLQDKLHEESPIAELDTLLGKFTYFFFLIIEHHITLFGAISPISRKDTGVIVT